MSALCDCLIIGMHALSLHSSPSYVLMENTKGETIQTAQYETFTPGLYIRHESGFTAGTYSNSFKRQSFYAGWTWETEDERWAFTIGAVTGYGRHYVGGTVEGNKWVKHYFGYNEVEPLFAPSFKLPVTENSALRLTVLPSFNKGASVLHFSYEFKL